MLVVFTCQIADSSTATTLYGIIEQAFKMKNVPLDKMLAKSYDGL